MKIFAVDKWEVDEVGDKLNKQLFKQGSKKLRIKHNAKFDGIKVKDKEFNVKKMVEKDVNLSHKNQIRTQSEKKSRKRPHKVPNIDGVGDSKKSKFSPEHINELNKKTSSNDEEKMVFKHSTIQTVKKTKFRKKERNNKGTTHTIEKKLNVKKIQEMLLDKKSESKNGVDKPETLRDRMMSQLRASRFRYLNETLYNNQSFESQKMFKEDPDAFEAYHTGYRQQVERWPLNPLDIIISAVKKMPKDFIIADFGCGEARLASSVEQKVSSLDLVALNDKVIACDMAHTPLLSNGVHVVVSCLSLMGGNLSDYILEANRVLKKDGILKIADIESRFDDVHEFLTSLESYGFKNTWKDLSHNLFYFMDFKKVSDADRRSKKLPTISLKSCLYKKR